MSYNGSGVFTRIYNWVQDRNNGIKILAARMDAEMDGFATGLSTALCKDGQQTPTADIPLGGFKLKNVGNATLATDAVNAGQIQNGLLTYSADTGVADAYVITPSPPIAAYGAGQKFSVKIAHTNLTNTPTLNVAALGAKSIKQKDGSNPSIGSLLLGGIYTFEYDGTNFQVSTGLSATPSFSTLAVTGTTSLQGTVTVGGVINTSAAINTTAAINEAADVTIASSGTGADIGAAASNNVIISGTTTITAFPSAASGIKRKVKFSGILTLTHSAGLLLPAGGANITTAANDESEWQSLGSGNWKCIWYQPATGKAVVPPAVTSASQTLLTSSQTFTTPSDVTSATVYRFTIIGPGGGSAGCATSTCGGAGGGGNFAQCLKSGLAASTGYSYTQGAVGTAGPSGGNAGGNAGNSSFVVGDTTMSGNGGNGGNVAGGAAVNGGSASTPGGTVISALSLAGTPGEKGINANINALGARGGVSPHWLGAGPAPAVYGAAGIVGIGYGAGASGAAGQQATGPFAGAAGQSGCLLIERISG